MAPDQDSDARRLRILMLAARYLPFSGGTEMHVHEVSTRLARAGHDVTILTSDPSGQLPARETNGAFKIVRVPAWPRRGDLYLAPAMFREILQGQWDVMHVQGYHTCFAPMGMAAAIKARIPFIVTFHSGGHSSGLRNAVRGLQSRLLRPLVRRAARLIAVSEFEADTFSRGMGIARELFTVSPNGAGLPPLDGIVAETKTDEALIVSVGRLERYKGHQRAIAAMPHLLERVPNARLRIVGHGTYEPALRALIEKLGLGDRVMVGAIPSADRRGMATLLSRASLVVLLSDYEAHPVAVMEAAALGRPTVVLATSGLLELAERGIATAVPPTASHEEIARAMADEILLPRERPAIALPTWEDCTEQLQSIYRSVVRNVGAGECARLEC